MREVGADLFEYACDALVVPINWQTKRDGTAVMGAGVAKLAAGRWPWLPPSLGARIRQDHRRIGTTFFDIGDAFTVVCLPTKRDWRNPSDPNLIAVEVGRLAMYAELRQWQTVVLPRLGCGRGGLDWEQQVRPLLVSVLDDRFVVCHPADGAR